MNRITSTIPVSAITLPINLSNSYNKAGNSQEIETFVTNEMDKAINKVLDKELKRFKPASGVTKTIEPQFLKGGTYSSNYTFADFSELKVRAFSESLINSMFIFEYYDSIDPETQRRVSYNFVKCDTKGTYANITGGTGTLTSRKAYLSFNSAAISPEFNVVYYPQHLVQETGTTKVYMRVSFFNALSGKRQFFGLNSLTDENKHYLPITLDFTNKTYQFDSAGTVLQLREIVTKDSAAETFGEHGAKPKLVYKRGKISELISGKPTVDASESIPLPPPRAISSVTIPVTEWYSGNAYVVNWSGASTSGNVKLTAIFDDGTLDYVIVGSTPNDGSYTVNYNAGSFNFGMTGPQNISIKVEMVTDPTDCEYSNTVVISYKSYPPIAWGSPSANTLTWFDRNTYSVDLGTTPAPTTLQQKAAVAVRYTDANGNVCTVPVSPYVVTSATTSFWVNEFTFFNATFVSNLLNAELYLLDESYPDNISKVGDLVVSNLTNGTSTTYNPAFAAPVGAAITLPTFTKPLANTTLYHGTQYEYDWTPHISGEQVILYHMFYTGTRWLPRPIGSDRTAVSGFSDTYSYGSPNFVGNISDGFLVMEDSEYRTVNYIKRSMRYTNHLYVGQPQTGLTLTSVTPTTFTFMQGGPITINWTVVDNYNVVDVVVRHTDANGTLTDAYIASKMLNTGTVDYTFLNEEYMIPDGNTSAVVRVRDSFDITNKFYDSATVTLTIEVNYYGKVGYQQGWDDFTTMGSKAPYPPNNGTPTQRSAYTTGYNKGYNDHEAGRAFDTSYNFLL